MSYHTVTMGSPYFYDATYLLNVLDVHLVLYTYTYLSNGLDAVHTYYHSHVGFLALPDQYVLNNLFFAGPSAIHNANHF